MSSVCTACRLTYFGIQMVQTSLFIKWFIIQMVFGYQTFYHGPDHWISDHQNTQQLKVFYSDKFAIRMFAIQIPTVFRS